jgi:uncharacterized protein (TIGR03083 family)
VTPDEHISALERQGGLLADAADRRGLDAPVPACAGWQVRDLLRHVGYVHRWAAGYVGQALRTMVPEPPENEILRAGPEDAGLLGWFRDGLGELVTTLRSADPGLECWTFMAAPTPLAFWARRQAHETAVHRADAEGASGDLGLPRAAPFPAAFAADGIDELLTGFAPRSRPRAGTEAGRGQRLRVLATDTGDEWLTEIGPRVVAQRGTGSGTAQCVVTGPASDVYLALWNRQPLADPVLVSGDKGVLEAWQARVQVTWE